MIALLFTGGTISMRHDEAQGGAVPSLGAHDLVAAARDVERIATLEVEDWGRHPGPHMTIERMWALRNRIIELVARADVDGVVVTHGTDTMEESAYLVARAVPARKPVVFTGAMRPASDSGWDGPVNLADAVRTAVAPEAAPYGALVVMGSRIFAAIDVTKVHTHLNDAFDSPGLGPVGVVDDGRVRFRRSLPHVPPVLCPDAPALPVDIVLAFAGADARLIDAARESGARGVVVAALGRGNVPPALADGIARCVDAGVPVVIASRVPRGRVGTTYGYPGGGQRLAGMGALFAGHRRPQQARIDLMLALGAGLTGDALRGVFGE